MNRIFPLLFAAICLTVIYSPAQTVYTEPPIPTADEAVTVYFNSEGTGLEGYTGDVYSHTGVTIDDNQWQYVIGTWGNNNSQPQLTDLGSGLYKLEMLPSIREFYEAPAGENITEMCFVFRSEDASQQTSPDIFVEVYELGLNVNLVTPDESPYFVNPEEEIEVLAEATLAETISLYVDGTLIASVSGNTITETITASPDPDTKHWIKAVAEAGGNQVADSNYYYVRGETEIAEVPGGLPDGINYIDDQTVTLVIHAPFKESIYLIGDFNDWQVGPEYKLKRTTQGINGLDTRYWVTISGLNPGQEYAFQYLIDEELRVADPYADKILDNLNDPYIEDDTYPNLKPYPINKTTKIVSVLQTAQPEYEWQVQNFERPEVTDLVIYELLLRDFLEAHDFKTLKDTIPYFKRMGFNAIELMPVSEFEGNLSWGYNPSFYFAPDKYYGPKDDMKAFIDECHANGIAVIMDMVLNHAYGQNVMARMYWDEVNNQPAPNNPWFNAECPHQPYCWGNDFNHESPYTQAFVDRVNAYWLTEYRIDGYRFDYTQGFTNTGSGGSYDATRIAIIKRMADELWAVSPDAYVILEHWTENSEEKELTNYGCMVWANLNYHYNEATMGWNNNSNFSGVSYLVRNFNYPHLIGFMESHDEERLMAKNINYGNSSGSYNIQDTVTALKRIELAAAFFIPVPGPKMVWQFGEMGYDYHINYPGEIGQDDHRLDPKPIRWDYLEQPARKELSNVFGRLNHLKQNYEAFATGDFTMAVNGAFKRIWLNHNSMNVTIIGNFGVTEGNIDPDFQHTGNWYGYFGQDTLTVDDVNSTIMLQPGEYRIYTDQPVELPPPPLGINEMEQEDTGSLMIFPNPASGEVNISFSLAESGEVEVAVYDMSGRQVTKRKEYFGRGIHEITWNCTDDRREKVGQGLYVVEVIGGGERRTGKAMIW